MDALSFSPGDFENACRAAGVKPEEACVAGGVARSTWFRWKSEVASPNTRTVKLAYDGIALLLFARAKLNAGALPDFDVPAPPKATWGVIVPDQQQVLLDVSAWGDVVLSTTDIDDPQFIHKVGFARQFIPLVIEALQKALEAHEPK